MPTKKEPLIDGISGATPHKSFEIKLSPTTTLKKFIVKIEINHSTDFNEYFPKSAKEGEANYSGGKTEAVRRQSRNQSFDRFQ